MQHVQVDLFSTQQNVTYLRFWEACRAIRAPYVEGMLEAQSIFICQGWQRLKLTFRFPLTECQRWSQTLIQIPFELHDLLTEMMVLYYYFSAWILIELPWQRWDDFLCHLSFEKWCTILFFYNMNLIFCGLAIVLSTYKKQGLVWMILHWNEISHPVV